jgi:hypothetical protein
VSVFRAAPKRRSKRKRFPRLFCNEHIQPIGLIKLIGSSEPGFQVALKDIGGI